MGSSGSEGGGNKGWEDVSRDVTTTASTARGGGGDPDEKEEEAHNLFLPSRNLRFSTPKGQEEHLSFFSLTSELC